MDIQGAWVNAIGSRINMGWLSVVLIRLLNCTLVFRFPRYHKYLWLISALPNLPSSLNFSSSRASTPLASHSQIACYFGYVLSRSSLLVLSSSSSLAPTVFSHHQAHSAGCVRSTTFSLHPGLFQIPLAVLFLITTTNPSPLPSLGASCPQFLQIHHRHGHKHHGRGQKRAHPGWLLRKHIYRNPGAVLSFMNWGEGRKSRFRKCFPSSPVNSVLLASKVAGGILRL